MAEAERQFKTQNRILENRKRLNISGVKEVIGFDDSRVSTRTSLGDLTVHGTGLRVENLSVESGELVVTGEIGELVYEQNAGRPDWRKRLFG